MKRKFVVVLMLSLLGCSNDVQKPTPAPVRRVEIETPRGKVFIQNPVQNLEERYATANVVGDGIDYIFRVASAGDGITITGGVVELLDASSQLLFSIESLVNSVTGEVIYTQRTPEDYLTQSIVTDDEHVWEHYDANGDVASFEYPALPEETQRRAANHYRHGLPATSLPPDLADFVTKLGAFDAYYTPHATSTLHNNPNGALLVQILTSKEMHYLVVGGESDQWRWAEQLCTMARVCQTMICYTHPVSIGCFVCTAVSTACAIFDFVCNWLGC